MPVTAWLEWAILPYKNGRTVELETCTTCINNNTNNLLFLSPVHRNLRNYNYDLIYDGFYFTSAAMTTPG